MALVSGELDVVGIHQALGVQGRGAHYIEKQAAQQQRVQNSRAYRVSGALHTLDGWLEC